MTDFFRRQWDLIFIFFLLSIYTLLFVFDPGNSQPVLRLVLSVPILFFFPGYLLDGLFFRIKKLMPMEKLGLDMILSMCVLVFEGLSFNWIGISLDPYTMIYSLVGICVVLMLVVFVVRLRYSSPPIFEKRISPVYVFAFVLMGALLVGSFSYSLWVNPRTEEFTALSITDGNGKTDLPLVVNANDYSFNIAVTNNELVDMGYVIQIKYDDQTQTLSVPVIVKGETWSKGVNVHLDENTSFHRLEVLLFRLDNASPYRKVHLWISTIK
jgi:uncharacterized membrane protein